MRVLLSLAVFALLASVASAAAPTYEEVTAWALKHNKPITVSVGRDDPSADMRCDWYADQGYAKGTYTFVPNGKGWFEAKTPAATIRQYRTVQGSCANGQCGR